MKAIHPIHSVFIFSLLILSVLAACTIPPGSQAPTSQVVKETVLVIVTSTPAPESTTSTTTPQPTDASLTGTPSPTYTDTPTATSRPFVAPSLTPLALMNVPIEGGDPNHKFYALLVYPIYQPAATKSLWFRVYAHEPTSSKVDGKNIDNVTFTINDNGGNPVYFREEKVAGYCAFGGGEPNCNVYDFASQNYYWVSPNGTKVKMVSGKFDIHIIATDISGNVMFGDGTFTIKVP